VNSAGDRSASLVGVPFVSRRVPLAVAPQLDGNSDRNQITWPQLTLQLQDAELLTHAKPYSSWLHVQHAPLPQVDVEKQLPVQGLSQQHPSELGQASG